MMLGIVFALVAADLSPVALERACDEPKVVLVESGRARLPIVTPDGTRERAAAHYLASAIRRVSGVRPTIYVETPACPVTIAPALRIAPSGDGDAFRVITKDGSVRFLGRSDYAVYDWCERVLDVRNYCREQMVVPGVRFKRGEPLAVEAVDYADRPVFAHRRSGGDRVWTRTLKSGGAHDGGVHVHAPHRWFADPDVRTNHPNIFARQPDGSRGEMPLLCYGNPETLAYYKRRIDEHIAGVRDSGGIVDTNKHVITVSHWDVLLSCTCEHCRRLFDPALGMTGCGSPLIWGHFLKKLAVWVRQAHPDYTIAFLPYLNVCDVPKGLDLTTVDNCEAMLCSMPGLAMFKEPSVRAHEETLIRDWARVTGRPVLNWHYGCWPREFTSAPYLYGKTIVEHYRRMAPYVVGSYVCGGGGPVCERLSVYVWYRCLWNPAVDVDAIYDGFARRLFGAGAPPMRRLMAMQEGGWMRHWPRPHVSLANTYDVSWPPEDIAEMKRLLCEAALRTRGDACAAANVRWYAADFTAFFAEEERYRAGVRFPPLTGARAETAPTVDGILDESCWTSAPARAFVAAFGTRPPVRATDVRAVTDEKGVYFAVRCAEPAMATLNRSAAYGELKTQDTLELFFDPTGTSTGTCYRLMVDVRNRLVATASDIVWSASGVTSAVACGADGWCVELFVPFAALSGPVSRTHWRGNFVRWHPGSSAERERTRLATRGDEWNQDRDSFCDFNLSP